MTKIRYQIRIADLEIMTVMAARVCIKWACCVGQTIILAITHFFHFFIEYSQIVYQIKALN